MEDQGWVAWFTIAAILDRPITIYGNGKQVRDILHIDDLVAAYDAVISNGDAVTGEWFNIGGGMQRTMSLRELLVLLEEELGKKPMIRYEKRRPGDQAIFVCDIGHAASKLSWYPTIGLSDGVQSMIKWVSKNRSLFRKS
jgi:CDP-paratose 2-epimerase